MNHRFLVDAVPSSGERLRLDEEETKHARVLRLRDGEHVEIFDGRGTAASAVVIAQSRNGIEIEVTSPADPREPAITVTLALGLIHPERFELAIQKGTELGASRFVPVLSRYTEIRTDRASGKIERWRRIASEAAKQCGRARIPDVSEPTSFEDVLTSGDCVLFDPSGAHPTFAHRPGVTLLVGPEGGWDPSEVALARSRGAEVASLGARRLRAETAAIVAVAASVGLWG